MIKCVAVHVGYCEDSHLGMVTFTHPMGFDTPAEAVRNLANGIYSKLYEDCYRPAPKACCKKTLEKDAEAKYCSKCRAEVGEKGFDIDDHVDQVRQLLLSTADSFGGEDITGELPEDEGVGYIWQPWNHLKDLVKLEPTEIVEILSHGEEVLTAMLSPEKLPVSVHEEFQKWIKGTYFENREELGLPKYRS